MVTFRKLLFPTDFSEASEAAWPYAKTLAEKFGAEVVVLHVVPEVATEPHLVAGFQSVRHASTGERSLDRLKQDLMSKTSEARVCLTPRVREGLAAWEIVKEAREAGADLIVMGTRGRAGLAHLLRRSVAEEVVREAPCPVIRVCSSALRRGQPGKRIVSWNTGQPATAQQTGEGDGSHGAGGTPITHPAGRAA